MVVLGIILGITAATLQSMSYLASRHFIEIRQGGRGQLIVLSHIIMGVSSFVVLPFIWPGEHAPWSALWRPLVGVSLAYLGGQLLLMVALRYTEPSRVSLLLTFKLVILAGFTMVLLHITPSPLQFLALGFCFVGMMLLNTGESRTDKRAMAAVLCGCFFYSTSDWNIKILIDAIGPMPLWQKYLWSTLLTYAFCGLLAVPFLPRLGSTRWSDWRDSAPFAYSWLLAMVALFGCFGALGDVLFGNILQSTRGLISIGLGYIVAHLGHEHIEAKPSRDVLIKRLIVAALMIAAVGIYAMERKRLGH